MKYNEISVSEVEINKIENSFDGELSDCIYRTCLFCCKNCQLRKLIQRLSGVDKFFCDFCLRHNMHTKNNRNVLILSFRNIISHYYFNFYSIPTGKKMWISEIKDFIELHRKAGMQNPILLYDPETFLWFVDFMKIGTSKRKLRIEELLQTVTDIIDCFNISEHVSQMTRAKNEFYEKYEEGIRLFHEKRIRPEGNILIPKLVGSELYEPQNFTMSKIRRKH